ncbi:MAG: DUF6261 family protein [Bacteroidales bacterium]|jgi:hypothetical protein|nr:DUF6261 family protein [Bacteroidales bacterium]
MQIKKFNQNNLRNDEHFQFHTEFRNLVQKHLIDGENESRQVRDRFEPYLVVFNQEDEALVKITKSALTAELLDADKARDVLFRGMADANISALNHFKPDVQKAAERLKIVLDTYGNLAQKPLDAETSAINNLLQDLEGQYAADAKLVGVWDWVAELKTANKAFDQLMGGRYEETGLKTDLVLKDVRQQLDKAYRTIVDVIHALIVLEGDALFGEFIRNFNPVIDRYEALLAKRKGIAAVKKKEEETE